MPLRREIALPDGRTLVAHDSGAPDGAGPGAPVLAWHHGSPQTGALLEPVVRAAAARGIRIVSYGRPSYGGSTPAPGRLVADAAADTAAVMDAFGVGRFAAMGASGGGPHALAGAAVLGDRVAGVVTLAGIAPFTDAIDWFAGMQSPGGLRAARDGRAARARFAETETFDEAQFTTADWAALAGDWAPLGRDAGAAGEADPDGLIDDDVAFAAPWGLDLAAVRCPVLVIGGLDDRVVPPSHARLLAAAIPGAELRLREGDGHVSVLRAVPEAMDWLLANAAGWASPG